MGQQRAMYVVDHVHYLVVEGRYCKAPGGGKCVFHHHTFTLLSEYATNTQTAFILIRVFSDGSLNLYSRVWANPSAGFGSGERGTRGEGCCSHSHHNAFSALPLLDEVRDGGREVEMGGKRAEVDRTRTPHRLTDLWRGRRVSE